MNVIRLKQSLLESFKQYLYEQEKSQITIENYVRHIREFIAYAGEVPLSKDLTVEYKNLLIRSGKYKTESINTILASVNSFCRYLERPDCVVKVLRTQKKIYRDEKKELTKADI